MISVISMLVLLACFVVFVYICYNMYKVSMFKFSSGERQGRAAYSKVKREQPNSPEAQLSEAEFVNNFINNGPSQKKYIIYFILLMPVMLLSLAGIFLGGL